MNSMDLAVEDVVLGLAKSMNISDRPGLDGDISRWIFKTAFAFAATDRPERRHVPLNRMYELRKGKLPSSYMTFVHRTQAQRHIGAVLIDAWPEGAARFQLAGQENRFKFGVQYDNVIFGCAFVTWPNATFVLKPDLHQIVELHGAKQRYSMEFDELLLPERMANTRLNYILSALGVE